MRKVVVIRSKLQIRLDVCPRQSGLPYPPDAEHESSRSHIDPMFVRNLPY